MGKHFFTFIFLFLTLSLASFAQEAPVYNHYYNNLYLLSPAEIGNSGYMTVDFIHRQQWRGIEGAPVANTFTFQTPFNFKQSSVGFMIRNFSRGLITTNDILGSYSYKSYLTKNASLHFGMSLGITSNSIDMNEIDDPDDPILAQYTNNNMQPVGNFGFKLRTKGGLNLGVSLPKLFRTTYLNESSFQSYEFSPLDEVQTMLYFKKHLDKKIVTRRRGRMKRRVEIEDAYAPLQLYFMYKYSSTVNERIEVLGTLNLNENVWIGGAYRLNYGAAGLFGFKAGNLLFSYAYEPASTWVEGYTQGSHEVQLTIRIGEKKKVERKKPMLRTLEKTETHKARFSTDDISEGLGQDKGDAKEKKYYVVVKSFRDFNSADAFVRRMAEKELYTNIFYNKIDKQYHVYSYQTTKLKEANEQRRAVQELTKYKSVTIITVEQ